MIELEKRKILTIANMKIPFSTNYINIKYFLIVNTKEIRKQMRVEQIIQKFKYFCCFDELKEIFWISAKN